MKYFTLGIIVAAFSALPAFAQTPTATATETAVGTATATPNACVSLESCVATAVPSAVSNCVGTNSSCTLKSSDVLAVTAEEIATRAISIAKCNTRFASQAKVRRNKAATKLACNLCYERAKLPLANRFDTKIFHGLLAHAIADITAQKKSVCGAL